MELLNAANSGNSRPKDVNFEIHKSKQKVTLPEVPTISHRRHTETEDSRSYMKLPEIPMFDVLHHMPDNEEGSGTENLANERIRETTQREYLARTASENIRLAVQREAQEKKRSYIKLYVCFLFTIIFVGVAIALVSFLIFRSSMVSWTHWNQWSVCSTSTSCSPGQQHRNRSCVKGSITGCHGNSTEYRSCSDLPHCLPDWMPWNDWLDCDKACGSGRQQRSRICGRDMDKANDPDIAFDKTLANKVLYSEYSTESMNSAGKVEKFKSISVALPSPEAQCTGNSTETRPCLNLPPCPPPIDCTGVGLQRGVYRLKPKGSAGSDAFCDQGWTTIMRRFDGSQYFYLKWNQYKHGFGSISGEHWLGNDHIYHLTNQKKYKIRLEFKNQHKPHQVEYSYFRIENEPNRYRLHISGYQANGTKDALRHHNNYFFSTKDVDNDNSRKSCARQLKGAFWYTYCADCNPTGLYSGGVTYGPYRNCMFCSIYSSACLSEFTIKIKPQ